MWRHPTPDIHLRFRPNFPDIFLQGAFTDPRTHHCFAMAASFASSSGLTKQCKWPCFESDMSVGAWGHMDDTTGAVWRYVVFFLWFYYIWRTTRDWIILYCILLQSLWGLKHFTHPSISIGGWVDTEIFWWTIPFRSQLLENDFMTSMGTRLATHLFHNLHWNFLGLVPQSPWQGSLCWLHSSLIGRFVVFPSLFFRSLSPLLTWSMPHAWSF